LLNKCCGEGKLGKLGKLGKQRELGEQWYIFGDSIALVLTDMLTFP